MNLRYLLIPTVFSTLLLAWMVGQSQRPSLQTPSTLIRGIYWLKESPEGLILGDWDERADRQIMVSTARTLYRLDGMLRSLRQTVEPIAVIISFAQPEVVDIQATRVVLGSRLVEDPKSLSKVVSEAVLRAWLFQTLPAVISSDPLRSTVVSDVLLEWSLGQTNKTRHLTTEPLSQGEVQTPRPAWNRYLQSLASVCGAQQVPLEWRSLCGPLSMSTSTVWFETSVHRFSLREFFAQAILHDLKSVPWMRRPHILQEWLGGLSKTSKPALPLPTKTQAEWRTWVASENQVLGLEPTSTSLVEAPLDYIAHFENHRDIRFFSGRLEATVPAEERGQLAVRHLLWESCQVPTVGEILSLAGQAKQFLFVQTCQWPAMPLRYEAYLQAGVEVFAREHKNLVFVTGHVGSLQLALDRKLVSRQTSLTEFHHNQTLRWNHLAQAYQVESPIESIQWARPQL